MVEGALEDTGADGSAPPEQGGRRAVGAWRRSVRKRTRALVRLALQVPLGFVLAGLTFVVPRDPERFAVVPRTPSAYDGNAKSWHVYVASDPGPEVATLITDRSRATQLGRLDVSAVAHLTPASVWTLLRAGHVFFESTWWGGGFRGILTRGATRWQLWHGNGIKAVAFINPSVQDKASGRSGLVRKLMLGRPDRVDVALFASASQVERRGAAFNATHNVVTGQTRDTFIVPPRPSHPAVEVGVDAEALGRVRHARSSGRRVVLYAPTWRSRRQLSHWVALDWERMASTLEALDAVLVVKAHAKDGVRLSPEASSQLGERVVVADPKSDLIPLLVESDVMITDYSSVFADFLLLDRPVLFFRYDDDTYAEHRALGEVEHLPGRIVTTNAALAEALEQALASDPDAELRRGFARGFIELPDGRSCERLMGLVREWNAGRRPAA